MAGIVEKLTRRKVVDFGHSELRRVLGILDLTMLGVGSTIGVGIYVLAGEVSRSTSGPAVTISFLIAAIASLFAGLCYAEFGARVPKAGSAYIYTYVCIGEFVAFIVGWNLILEYVIGTASVARGFSQYVDALANDSIENAFYNAMPLVSEDKYYDSFLSPYPDFLSFGLALVLSVTLALGVKESSTMNNIFTGINIIVILFVIIAAGTQANTYYWSIPEDEVEEVCNVTASDPGANEDWGTGGFVPFGFEGVMEGAATCFFGFVGFDVIATTGEEALNPSRTIPISIGLSLFIIFLSYFGVSAVITLAVPYCLQDKDAPLVVLFDEENIGWPAAKWFVSIGALFGFSASLFGAMFPLPRVIYAMASDGLVFRSLSSISKKFQTPTLATALSGLFAGLMAMLFNLDALVNMMSIGTLMAYTIVAVCVMLLRYRVDDDEEEAGGKIMSTLTGESSHSASEYVNQFFNTKRLSKPTDLTASLVTYAILSFCALMLVFDVLLVTLGSKLAEGNGWAIAAIVIVGALNILNVLIIALQPQSQKQLSFKVPLVPWLPAFSTFINLYLMCNLKVDTWIRFAVWMAIGFLDYFAYGLMNSSLNKGGNANQGHENLGYLSDNLNKQQLVIPTIEIQPATPLSSEPNTPVVKPKEQKTPLPPSPLAAAETQGDSSVGSQSSKTSGNDLDGLIYPVSAAAIVASLMTGEDDKEKNTEDDTDKGKDTDSEDGDDKIKKKDEGNSGNMEKEEEKMRGSGSPELSVVNEVSQDGADKALQPIIIGSPQLPAETSAPFDSTDSGKTEENTKEEDKKMDVEKLDDEKPDTKTEDKEKEDSIKDKDTNGKDKHVKPPPLDLSSANPQNSNEESSGIPRAFYSSPEFSPPQSPPPSPPPSSPASSSHPPPTLARSVSENTHIRSVPTTPVGRRHPVKVLRRMSSFDDIPPSSPDSPFAKRVASFVVIPVKEPGMDSTASSIPASPSTKESTLSQENLSKAVDVLNKYKRDEDKILFTVGSVDSLDSLSPEPGDDVEFLSPRRELDPIRERGESKIYANDIDKTEINPSPEEATKSDVSDIHSPKTDTQNQEGNK